MHIRELDRSNVQDGNRSSQNWNAGNIVTFHICKSEVLVRALKCWNRFNNSFQVEDIPQALVAV